MIFAVGCTLSITNQWIFVITFTVIVLSVDVQQTCEMYMAGFKFVVLNNAFLVHPGFKYLEDLHPSYQAELDKNFRLYKQFQKDMKKKYFLVLKDCERK